MQEQVPTWVGTAAGVVHLHCRAARSAGGSVGAAVPAAHGVGLPRADTWAAGARGAALIAVPTVNGAAAAGPGVHDGDPRALGQARVGVGHTVRAAHAGAAHGAGNGGTATCGGAQRAPAFTAYTGSQKVL